jgi:glycosyltransferase involved in cell wall biosynthesis
MITRGEAGGAQVHVAELIAALRDRIDYRVVVGEEGFLRDTLRSLGVTVHLLPELQRELAPARDRRALAALRALVRETRPHLVHTHSTKAGLVGRLAARLEGVPSIHTAHAWSFSDGIALRRKLIAIPTEWVAARWTTRFIAVSEADREVAVRWRVASSRQVRVIHNGVADVCERASPGAGDPPVILMVARLADPKDPALLLRALSRVRCPYRLRLVGDGPDRAAVEAAVAQLGLASRVELLGVRRDIPALWAGAQIATLVSRQEGFPLVILEAMRAGLPVVASDVGGVREAIREGVTGLLCPRGDEGALTAAFERLLSRPDLRMTMGAAGREAYEARFSAGRMVDRTAALYAEIALAHGFPPPSLGTGGGA